MTSTIMIMGMVRDILDDFIKAHTGDPIPQVWTDTVDMKSGRRVTVDDSQANEMAQFILAARQWSMVKGVFKDNQRKSNVKRHSSRIATEFAQVAGVEIVVPVVGRRQVDESGQVVKPSMPTVVVDDLVKGDEITVVKHITLWGLDKYETYPARVKGRAANGDYWVTSLDDGCCRACRSSEVIVTKRAALAVVS